MIAHDPITEIKKRDFLRDYLSFILLILDINSIHNNSNCYYSTHGWYIRILRTLLYIYIFIREIKRFYIKNIMVHKHLSIANLTLLLN